jgi:hypothetical protein
MSGAFPTAEEPELGDASIRDWALQVLATIT